MYVPSALYRRTSDVCLKTSTIIIIISSPPLSLSLYIHTDGTGTACIGSSEAIMLAVLAMKWRWRTKRQAQGKPHEKPNLVMGSNAQICWKKVRWMMMTVDRCRVGG